MIKTRYCTALLLCSLGLTACYWESDQIDQGNSAQPRASLAPKTIIHYSETGEPEALEQFTYQSVSEFDSVLYTGPGADEIWGTPDDLADGHTLCRYQDEGFMAPTPFPLFVLSLKESIFFGQIFEEVLGINSPATGLQRCPSRLLSNLVEEKNSCESERCEALLGPVGNLQISNDMQPGRVLQQQMTLSPMNNGQAGSLYLYFTQLMEVHYDASGIPTRITEQSVAPLPPIGEGLDFSLPEFAAENCPESPSFILELTLTGPACWGLKRESELSLNSFQADVSSQRYYGLYPQDVENSNRYYDETAQRVYDLGGGDFPPSQDDTFLKVTDFSNTQEVSRYTLQKGPDQVWFTEDDEQQVTYRASLNSSGQPLMIETPSYEYHFRYTPTGQPDQIDHVIDGKLDKQRQYLYDNDGTITIDEKRHSDTLDQLVLRHKTVLAPQPHMVDFIGDFPVIPKTPVAPNLQVVLYGELLDGYFPSLSLLSQTQGNSAMDITLDTSSLLISDLNLSGVTISGITLGSFPVSGGAP